MAHLRIGSRGSRLALWQSNHIAARLHELGHTTSLEIIKTTGDKIDNVALSKVGTKGMFTKELEGALLEHKIDLAVHSLKDMPTEIDPAFVLAAITEREDSRDAFVSVRYEKAEDLPLGAHVGTSSLRRQAQLLALRNDLRVSSLRGNVDTRLRMLESGKFEAIILAAAGLRRLGLTEHIRQYFPPETMCPAVGQGALAIETRADDAVTLKLIEALDHPPTRRATDCERALLRSLGGGCQVPVGAFAVVSDTTISLRAVVARPDGKQTLCESRSGPDPQQLGSSVAQALLAKGAQDILDTVEGLDSALDHP
jgi:hydroxymethylbilane synthase